eukprot:67051-Chlamydomonas_euryale.AAC.2
MGSGYSGLLTATQGYLGITSSPHKPGCNPAYHSMLRLTVFQSVSQRACTLRMGSLCIATCKAVDDWTGAGAGSTSHMMTNGIR